MGVRAESESLPPRGPNPEEREGERDGCRADEAVRLPESPRPQLVRFCERRQRGEENGGAVGQPVGEPCVF